MALALLPPAATGMALAVTTVEPLIEGRHEQVATKGEVALVNLFLQPGMMMLRALNVTFEAVLTFAVITTGLRKEAFDAMVNELKVTFTGIFSADMPKLYLLFK